jgi:hypothetical protein
MVKMHGLKEDRWVVGVKSDYMDGELLLSDLMTGKKSGYLKFGKHLKKEDHERTSNNRCNRIFKFR